MATVLVQEGTLHVGDAFVCGVFYGKVRAMVDDQGRKVDAAPPSFPVEILGLQGVPQAGDSFVAVTDEAKARQVAGVSSQASKERPSWSNRARFHSRSFTIKSKRAMKGTPGRPQSRCQELGGSSDREALNRISSDEVKFRVIHGSVGGITESDILLAAASNAIVNWLQCAAGIQGCRLGGQRRR